MKLVKRMEIVLIHLCCVCSLLLLAVRVLNWYNPYMGVLDRNLWIADCLCLCSILSAILSTQLDIGTKREQHPADQSERKKAFLNSENSKTLLEAAAKKEVREI